MNDTTLIIREVRLDDAGRYDCTASNSFGRDVQSLSLDVTGTMTTKYYSVFRNSEDTYLTPTIWGSAYEKNDRPIFGSGQKKKNVITT